MQKEISLTTKNGEEFNNYYATPDVDGKFPAVIVIHEIWGLDQNTKNITDRFAKEGFLALAPDLLSETGILEKINPSIFAELHNPEKRHEAQAKMREAMQPTSTKEYAESTIEKLQACIDSLLADPNSNGKVGVVGFCFGGTWGFHIAIKDSRIGACIPFYGQPPQPSETIKDLSSPVLAFYGEQDERLIASLPSLIDAMKEYGKDFNHVVYKNCGHAFFNSTNKIAYSKEAADDSWERSLEFLRRNLG